MNKRGKKMDSLSYLTEKFMHLQQKYPQRPRYCALRMMITAAHAIFMCQRQSVNTKHKKTNMTIKKTPVLVFDIKGGLGDFIIAINFIYCLSKFIDDIEIKIKIAYHSQEIMKSFCACIPGLLQFETDVRKLTGDVVVEINRFPRVLSGDCELLGQYSVKLKMLFKMWNNFFIHYRKFFDLMPQVDRLANDYSRIVGSKRINQADIGHYLHIPEQYQAPISFPENELAVLAKFGLTSKTYITIQRGQSLTEKQNVNNKLWPPDYYDDLALLLKKHYPQFMLVQLGMEREGFNCNFQGIDINLRGKTDLEDLKVVLKNSALHIDTEGGLVHLRHAVQGGPSIVLFGPTSPEIYGYKENLNLRSDTCPIPCEWIANDWVQYCPRRLEKNICLRSLTPVFVFQQIQSFWTNHKI